jgi:predicted transcriptional regulator
MGNGHTPTWEARRARAVELLAGGATSLQAAEVLGISAKAVQNWMKTEPFQAQLSAITQEARSTISRRIASLAAKALSTCEEILDDPTAERWARLRAAENILSRAGFDAPGPGAGGAAGGLAIVAELFERRLADLPGEEPQPALPADYTGQDDEGY